MRRAFFVLALLLAAVVSPRAQETPPAEPAPAPAPHRLLPGERPPGRFMAELAAGGVIQLHAGRVAGLRGSPLLLDAGAGLHFTPKWGAAFSARYTGNPLAPCCNRDAGWATAGLIRNGRRESDYWGAGPAWRESDRATGRLHERGWALVYRKNFHDGIWNTAMTGELQCFPGQCSAGLGFSLGLYF